MQQKWWRIVRGVGVIFVSIIFGLLPQNSSATLDTLTSSDPDIAAIDTTTGRYLRPEIQPLQSNVPSIRQENNILIYIANSDILSLLNKSSSYAQAHQRIRLLLLKTMISRGFSGFISSPFLYGNNKIQLLVDTWFVDFVLLENIPQKDALDNLILNKLIQYKNSIAHTLPTNWFSITQREYDNLHNIYLFKNNEDLYGLGYEVVSYRYRINHDAAYRRYNISLAFSKIGNIRVINPHETFSFQDTIQNTDQATWRFMVGFAIVKGKTIPLYGGGLCGASTAFYQWILTNTALHIIQRSPHTKRYASLYNSVINGQAINTPGLDSTVFSTIIDMQATNTRDYPLVVILNYDGSVGGMEEVFSLGKISDKWTLQYKWFNKKCYIREINGTDVSSCYLNIF